MEIKLTPALRRGCGQRMSILDKVELEVEPGHRDKELHLLGEHVWEREHLHASLHVMEHVHLYPLHGCVVE
jgi:hypothetical protein